MRSDDVVPDDGDLPSPAGDGRQVSVGEIFDEDRDLIAGCRRGERASHFALYSKYSGKVYGLARRFLGDDQHAEDVTQEVFLRVFRKLHAFRGDSRFSTWLFRVTVNGCKNKRRSLERHGRVDGDRFVRDRFGGRRSPDEELCQQALGNRIDRALGRLTEDQRLLIALKAVDDLSYREIADRVGQSEAQVRGRLYRARKAFRAALEEAGDGISAGAALADEEVVTG